MTKPDALLDERGKTHGDFSLNAELSQSIKNVHRLSPFHGGLPDDVKEALDMIALKTSRILSGQHGFKDHWDDVAGYAMLISKRINKGEQK